MTTRTQFDLTINGVPAYSVSVNGGKAVSTRSGTVLRLSVAAGDKVVVTPAPAPSPAPAPVPAPSTGAKLGLVRFGGSLATASHLHDGTYTVVLGDWDDAPLLGKVSGEGYVYTVTTIDASPGYVILDPSGANGLTAADYLAKVVPYCHTNNVAGVCLDNCKSSIPGILPALTQVVQGLHAAGLKMYANASSYDTSKPGADDGTQWAAWAKQLAGIGMDRINCEYWQQPANNDPPTKVRVTGSSWDQLWDQWQACVAAVPGRFVGTSHGTIGMAVYGRASMLTAAGLDEGDVFCWDNELAADPYDAAWVKANPVPVVDHVNGTATL